MRQILYHDAFGRILRVVASETARPEQYGAEPHLVIEAEQMISGHLSMVVADALQPRPGLPDLAIGPVAPAALDLSILPAGTMIRVTNEPGDVLEITDPTESLILTEPGQYSLRLTPPFPWAACSLTVELAHG